MWRLENIYKKNFLEVLLYSFIIFLFCSCSTIYNPVTERNEYIFIDTPSEVQIGSDFARQIEKDLKLSKDPSKIERVNAIGKKVASFSHRQDLEYHFFVVEDKQLNAFALPGGFIYVNTGLLEIVNDDELACVLGHEIAHISARHSVKAMQAALGYDVFLNIVFGSAKSQNIRLLGSVLFDLIHLKYSRQDEKLADRIGILYAYKAGYNPEGMVSFFEKLKASNDKDGGGEWLVFLRSHPSIESRIADAKKEVELLKVKGYNNKE